MFTVTVTYKNGKTQNFKAERIWQGKSRVTWVNSKGVRSYVLHRHMLLVTTSNR